MHLARVYSATDGRRQHARARTVLLDALFVLAAVVAYFGVRGLTAGDPATALRHAQDVLRVERAIGLDIEQGVQAGLSGSDGLTTFANWIYIWGHWPLIVATFLGLALHHRVVFCQLRDAMVVSGLLGLAVYTTYPVAPPRLSGLGMTDTVTMQSHAYRVLQPPAFVNQYAAMPSLHVGWDLLVGLALLAATAMWVVRILAVALPPAMAVATVLTANHYVLDVLVGVAFGLTGWIFTARLREWRARRGATGGTVRASERAASCACAEGRAPEWDLRPLRRLGASKTVQCPGFETGAVDRPHRSRAADPRARTWTMRTSKPSSTGTGVGAAVGAGLGITLAMLIGEPSGLAIGIAIGAGVGVTLGAAWDAGVRPGDLRRDRPVRPKRVDEDTDSS